ncbi:ABC transporter substrate-binding protein [Hypnocyclicus thermotrophus]|uniref:ABC transporter substrate-binding protein n=1 Tax=Hypnocyclicus thermotrophus TaxID=1627895 RepID=UPI0010653D33|nr:ABC transporter substrate binding protein [Hypnocyclicus thermotrophus]
MIYSYHQGLEWTDSISEGIKEKLSDYPNIKIYYEYLDTKRNFTKEYYNKLIDLYKEKVYTINFDLIIAVDNAAFEFALDYGDTLFKNIPIVFCGVNNFEDYDISKASIIAGVKEQINVSDTFEALIKMFPRRNKVYIILDNTLTGQKIYKEISPEIEIYKKYLDIHLIRDFVIEDLVENISKLDTNSSVIFLLTLNRDRSGRFLSYKEALTKINTVATVPIFGAWDFYLNKGIIGGSLVSGKNQGKKAAQIALRYLVYNEFPDRLILDTSTKYYFDYNKLKEFKVKYIPKNSIIINKPSKFNINIRYVIYIVFISTIIVGYLEIRIKQKEKAKKILKLEVEKRTKELEHLNAKLIKMATIDELTNIFNRRKILGELQRLINKRKNFV